MERPEETRFRPSAMPMSVHPTAAKSAAFSVPNVTVLQMNFGSGGPSESMFAHTGQAYGKSPLNLGK
jgi:hypothetical protein